ncbi:MAG TPA: DUF5362 family protein [Ferruginibacter sp.]|jgi:disulfide bond formation protein DsbB|nr:DUF5362 family protein [Ferruginibacter sp.]
MEQTPTNSIFELEINEEGKSQLRGIAQWGYVNALVSIISLGISIVTSVMLVSRLGENDTSLLASTVISTLLIVIVSLLLNLTLMAAANNIKKGLAGSDQGTFNVGLGKLTTYFRILGILTIIGLVILFLAIVIGLLAGASQGFK